MLKTDVINLAEDMNIAWDYDPVFMSISKEITGKSLLDEMSKDELESMFSYIKDNPHPFTKEAETKKPEFFRSNEDYTGDFLDKVRKRLKTLNKNLKNKDASNKVEDLERVL